METIKEILTNPRLAYYLRAFYSEMYGVIPTKTNVKKACTKIGFNKQLIDEYGEAFYMLQVINYVSEHQEGVNFKWVNKDTLKMKECMGEEIEEAKYSILVQLWKLLDIGGIDDETAESIKEQLNIEYRF